MPINNIKPRGTTKNFQPNSGGMNIYTTPVTAIVKDNVDPTRSGRLKVFVWDGNPASNQDDPSVWRTVRFLSPFFGQLGGSAPNEGYGSFISNPISYGMWHSPPDIGTEVICIFSQGRPDEGYYIGCVPDPTALSMVPAIGGTTNVILNEEEAKSYGGSPQLPTVNVNVNNPALVQGLQISDSAKPVNSVLAAIMNRQGVLRDPIRGPIGSSAQRETVSRVGFGISTPGRPIYEGGFTDDTILQNLDGDPEKLRIISRMPGHTFVMDDGDIVGQDRVVRLRTAQGHQILMSDSGQTLLIMHSNGKSYVELGSEGTVDVYSTNSVNIRTQGDLNLHADRDVNIHAGKKLNIHAENMHLNSGEEFVQRVGTNYKLFVVEGVTVKATGKLSIESDGDISLASKALAFVNGKKINLNTGKTSFVPEEVKPIDFVAHTDTLFDNEKGFIAAPGKLNSITSRAPAHAPWVNAGQGVDVKISLNASSELPAAPAAPILQVNSLAATAIKNPVSAATIAKQPLVGKISKAVNPTTTALLGAMATSTLQGPASKAATKGSAIIDTDGKKAAVIGTYGATPNQLEQAGAIKPGSAKLAESLIAQGKKLEQALPPNMWTGKAGAQNLDQFVKSSDAQAQVAVSNLQKSQSALTEAGIISGKEDGTQIAGVVLAGVQAGVKNTIDAVKNAASAGLSNLGNKLTAGASKALESIGQGNFAANLSNAVNNGIASIKQSVAALEDKIMGFKDAIDKTRGAVAEAFSAIKKKFKPMKANVPQNLTAIAKENAAENAAADASQNNDSGGKNKLQEFGSKLANVSGQAIKNFAENAISGAITGVLTGGGSQAVRSAIDSAKQGGIQSLVEGAKTDNVQPIVPGAASAGGVNNLPGGKDAISGVSNIGKSVQAGLKKVGDLIKNTATAALNKTGIPDLAKAASDGLQKLAAQGLPTGAAAKLMASIASVASGGPFNIKMPTVGENTTDETEINTQTAALIGDKRVPLSDQKSSKQAADELSEITVLTPELTKRRQEIREKYAVAAKLKNDYEIALKQYGRKNSRVRELAKEVKTRETEIVNLLKEYIDLKNNA